MNLSDFQVYYKRTQQFFYSEQRNNHRVSIHMDRI